MKHIDKMLCQARNSLRGDYVFEVMSRATSEEVKAREAQLQRENPLREVIIVNIVSKLMKEATPCVEV